MKSTLFAIISWYFFLACVVNCSPVTQKENADVTVPVNLPPGNVSVPSIPKKPVDTPTETTGAKDLNTTNAATIVTNATVETTIPPTTHSTLVTKASNSTAAVHNVTIPMSDETVTVKTVKPPTTTPVTAAVPTSTTAPACNETVNPKTTPPPATSASPVQEAQKDRQFDGPSFVGGIVLALGLTGIGFVAYKFCKARTDRNYRNL